MRPRVELTIHGHEAQRQFWQSQARYTLFAGGVGSGKTYAGAMRILMMPPSRGLVVAPTYTLIRDVAQAVFFELCPPALIESHNKAEQRTVLTTGVEILWRSADRPERLIGVNAGWCWGDEWSFVNEAAHLRLIARLRRPPALFWATTTPNGLNWLYERAVVDGRGWNVVHATSASNPHLPPEYLASLKAQYTTEYAQQELEGRFVDFSGGVFQRRWFDNRCQEPPPGLTWHRYWDLATSVKERADFVASIKGAWAKDGTLYLADGVHFKAEWPETRERIAQQAMIEPGVEVGIESVGFQLAAVQDLYTDPRLRNTTLRGVRIPRGQDKLQRALPWAARAEAGKVRLVAGPWVESFVSEVAAFPQGRHDDWVDAASGVVMMAPLATSANKATLGRPQNFIRRHEVF